mgnify:CR=1 FL=1
MGHGLVRWSFLGYEEAVPTMDRVQMLPWLGWGLGQYPSGGWGGGAEPLRKFLEVRELGERGEKREGKVERREKGKWREERGG